MEDKKDSFEKKLLKLEGDFYTFLIKAQGYDKKLEVLNSINSNINGFNRKLSVYEDNQSDNCRINTTRNNENNAKFQDIYKSNDSLSIKLDSLEIKLKQIQSLTNKIDLIEQKLSENITEVSKLSHNLSVCSDSINEISRKSTNAIENCKLEISQKVSSMDHKSDIESIKSMYRSFSNSCQDSFTSLKEHIQKLYLSHDTLQLHCEDFKKKSAESLNNALEHFKLSIRKEIESSKPKDILPKVNELEKAHESLRLDVSNNGLKREIIDREIDLINRKIEKLFLMVKKFELTKEG